jgi:hypothetical protein
VIHASQCSENGSPGDNPNEEDLDSAHVEVSPMWLRVVSAQPGASQKLRKQGVQVALLGPAAAKDNHTKELTLYTHGYILILSY